MRTAVAVLTILWGLANAAGADAATIDSFIAKGRNAGFSVQGVVAGPSGAQALLVGRRDPGAKKAVLSLRYRATSASPWGSPVPLPEIGKADPALAGIDASGTVALVLTRSGRKNSDGSDTSIVSVVRYSPQSGWAVPSAPFTTSSDYGRWDVDASGAVSRMGCTGDTDGDAGYLPSGKRGYLAYEVRLSPAGVWQRVVFDALSNVAGYCFSEAIDRAADGSAVALFRTTAVGVGGDARTIPSTLRAAFRSADGGWSVLHTVAELAPGVSLLAARLTGAGNARVLWGGTTVAAGGSPGSSSTVLGQAGVTARGSVSPVVRTVKGRDSASGGGFGSIQAQMGPSGAGVFLWELASQTSGFTAYGAARVAVDGSIGAPTQDFPTAPDWRPIAIGTTADGLPVVYTSGSSEGAGARAFGIGAVRLGPSGEWDTPRVLGLDATPPGFDGGGSSPQLALRPGGVTAVGEISASKRNRPKGTHSYDWPTFSAVTSIDGALEVPVKSQDLIGVPTSVRRADLLKGSVPLQCGLVVRGICRISRVSITRATGRRLGLPTCSTPKGGFQAIADGRSLGTMPAGKAFPASVRLIGAGAKARFVAKYPCYALGELFRRALKRHRVPVTFTVTYTGFGEGTTVVRRIAKVRVR